MRPWRSSTAAYRTSAGFALGDDLERDDEPHAAWSSGRAPARPAWSPSTPVAVTSAYRSATGLPSEPETRKGVAEGVVGVVRRVTARPAAERGDDQDAGAGPRRTRPAAPRWASAGVRLGAGGDGLASWSRHASYRPVPVPASSPGPCRRRPEPVPVSCRASSWSSAFSASPARPSPSPAARLDHRQRPLRDHRGVEPAHRLVERVLPPGVPRRPGRSPRTAAPRSSAARRGRPFVADAGLTPG